MPRPDRSRERREELLPLLAAAFAEMGYRRATTAALAKRCGVQEPILYRLWADKKAMFLAAIEHVYALSERIWSQVSRDDGGDSSAAQRILAYEADHHGEFGLYRILFAGLGETDDPEVEAHLRRTYLRFHRFVRDRIREHRQGRLDESGAPDADTAAWAILGVGTMASVGRELGLFAAKNRKRLLAEAGRALLEG